ncbi:MAG TPA: squalene synthase HpnC [Vicinamibacterales bacterium]|nr:squalene synthase HpnC [Vicinamibacterales bacterium]
MVDLASAYESCIRDARAHYENFPVASRLVPRHMRRHVAAVYAFARAADDFADEGQRSIEDRHRLLDGWLCRLRDAVADGAGRIARPTVAGEPGNTEEIFVALGATIREKALPPGLFEDLLSAFRQDVTSTGYASWNEVLDYCRRSANPVGRLVLRIGDYRDQRRDGWSDAICTALQLTNFWQDMKIDFDRGRVYLPEEEMRAHGVTASDLAGGAVTPACKRALGAAVTRTRAMFADGRPLCDAVGGRLGYELRATWLGGTRILDRLEATQFDVIDHRPSLGAADAPWFVWRMLTWSSGRS